MRHGIAHIGTLLLALAGNACALLYDFADDGSDGAGASGSSGTTSGNPGAGPAQGASVTTSASGNASAPSTSSTAGGCGFCAPTVNEQAPFLRVAGGDEIATCPAGYATIASVFGAVDFDPLSCGCNCVGNPPGCSAYVASGTSCGFTTNDAALAAGACTPYPIGSTYVAFLEASPTAACVGSDAVTVAPPPRHRDNVALCAATSPCDGGTCFDDAASACIGTTAGVPCPPEYPVERVYATGTVDHRVCTGCTCTMTDPSCQGALYVFDGSSACGIGTATIGVGQCTSGQVATGYLRYEPDVLPGCAPTTSHASGMVETDPATEIRICCAG